MPNTIPVDWYYRSDIYEKERILLQNMPQYRGHVSMIPSLHDYHVIPETQDTQVLIHNERGFELLSNVCRHRQSVLLTGRGNQKNITCPAHCWRYDTQGQLLQAPFFSENPKLSLHKIPSVKWQGLVFETQRQEPIQVENPLLNEIMDFSDYGYHSSRKLACPYNWKTFVETYLEIYHVKVIHPGLRNYIDCEDLVWKMGPHFSSQSLKIHPNWKTNRGSAIYKNWQRQLCEAMQGKKPSYGAEWMIYHPNIMIEHYPYGIVVSVVLPDSPTTCINHIDFFHPKEWVEMQHPCCEAFQAAYLETASEDDMICQKMDQGRRACGVQGELETGPFQSPLEDGIAHFHQFWVTAMNDMHGPLTNFSHRALQRRSRSASPLDTVPSVPASR